MQIVSTHRLGRKSKCLYCIKRMWYFICENIFARITENIYLRIKYSIIEIILNSVRKKITNIFIAQIQFNIIMMNIFFFFNMLINFFLYKQSLFIFTLSNAKHGESIGISLAASSTSKGAQAKTTEPMDSIKVPNCRIQLGWNLGHGGFAKNYLWSHPEAKKCDFFI